MKSEIVGQDAAAEPTSGLDALYRAHALDAFRLAFLLTGDRALAEDLTQDAFVRVFSRFRDLRDRDAFWWYLRRTVVNLSRSHFRRRATERAYAARRTVAPQVEPTDLGDRERLKVALHRLRPEQRAAVVLRFYEDLSEDDTARILGRPVGTVKSMVSRAMERLREELGEELTDDE